MIAGKCPLFIAVARLGLVLGCLVPSASGGGSLSSVSRLRSADSSLPNTPPHPAQLTGAKQCYLQLSTAIYSYLELSSVTSFISMKFENSNGHGHMKDWSDVNHNAEQRKVS